MSAVASDLWQRLAAYQIGLTHASLTFAQRLARENRWSQAFSERVMREYKRFCYLAVTAGQEMTPSDAVDQVWHLHLSYTRDYWERFCPDVLGTPLHHGPTQGGAEERGRFFAQYAATLKAYEDAFAQPPPEDIWPAARRRFGIDPRAARVNPADVIILPRRWGYTVGAVAALLLALAWAAGG